MFLFCLSPSTHSDCVFSLHFIKYIFRIKSAIGESSTIIFDWCVSPDEICANAELQLRFAVQRSIKNFKRYCWCHSWIRNKSELKIQAFMDNASYRINLYPVEITILAVSLILIHLVAVIYPVDSAFHLLNNWGLVQELNNKKHLFSDYCWWCCSFCIENLPFIVLMTFLSSKRLCYA